MAPFVIIGAIIYANSPATAIKRFPLSREDFRFDTPPGACSSLAKYQVLRCSFNAGIRTSLPATDNCPLVIPEALGPDADKQFLVVNHEAWLTEQMAETNPELGGTLDLPSSLDLEGRGYEVIPQGGFTKRGKLLVIHGDDADGGFYSAKKAAKVYAGSSVVLGHHHTLQVHSRSSLVPQTD